MLPSAPATVGAMTTKLIFNPAAVLLALLAGWMQRGQQRLIDYLIEENRVFKARHVKRRLRFTYAEPARIARAGKALGRKLLSRYATIATPDTILRWHRQILAAKWTFQRKRTGRPEITEEIQRQIVKMARANPGWGYDRLQGAVANLGHRVAASTVAAVLARNGIPPAPRRRTTWAHSIKSHKAMLAAADFFTVEAWTLRGLRTIYVLFAIRLATRKIEIVGITDSPKGDLMKQAARNLTDPDAEALRGATHMIIDRDKKHTDEFTSLLRAEGIKCVPIPAKAPDCSAFAERWVLSVKSECLNKMVFFGANSLRRAINEFVDHSHGERNHQRLGKELIEPAVDAGPAAGEVQRRDRLGGVLRYDYRAA